MTYTFVLKLCAFVSLYPFCLTADEVVDTNFLPNGIRQLYSHHHDRPIENQFIPRDDCDRLLNEFSGAAANYTFCGVKYARPVNLCLQCKNDYLRVISVYKDLEKFNQDGVTCKEILTKQDHLNVVTATYNYITDANGVWNLGNCNNCYTDSDPTKSISVDADTYIKLLNETKTCFKNFGDYPGNKLESPSNYSDLCGNCSESYYSTRKYFWESLVPNSKGGDYGAVCIDLKDTFNFTGYMWGNIFDCNAKLDNGAFSIFVLLPLGFLIGITYGVPTLFIPLYYGSKHKVLTLLAIPDHYDRAHTTYDSDVANVRTFVDETRQDGEESLSVEAAENLEIEKEIKRLIRQVARCRSDKRAGDSKRYEQELLDLLVDTRKISDLNDDVLDDLNDVTDAGDDIPFVERLRRRRIGTRGQSFHQPNIDWSIFGAYIDNRDKYKKLFCRN